MERGVAKSGSNAVTLGRVRLSGALSPDPSAHVVGTLDGSTR